MIAPLVPYAIKGVIWYQGEANAGRAYQYRRLFPDMIRSWRQAWGYDMPFVFVQLANYMAQQTDPGEASAWAELREAQTMTLALPNTAMAVAIDVGQADDIHPRDKQTVGLRLALAALGQVYGEGNQTSGPMLSKATFDPNANRVTLKFDHSGTGLMCRGEQLEGFVIANADRQFHWAKAKIIQPDTVIVWSEQVARPAAVRYGWANNPKVNLYNRQGLPAVPFRADNWPGVTADDQ
jgi:sialate O-acetylesterase